MIFKTPSEHTGLWEESAHAQGAPPLRPHEGRRRSLYFRWRHVLAIYGTMTL